MDRCWRVYGKEGHRQRESFRPSSVTILEDGIEVCVFNMDVTGTNEYSIIVIDAESGHEKILEGQLSDGAFENSYVGRVEEFPYREFINMLKRKIGLNY